MRKIGRKIAKPCAFLSFYHKLDFAVFFIAFSLFFLDVTIFKNLEGAPSIFQAWDIFGGGTLLR